MDTALARFYYEPKEEAERRRLVSTVFCSVMGLTLAADGILLLFSRRLALVVYGDHHYISYLRLALAAMPFVMANGVQMVVLRLERQVRVFNLIMIFNLLVSSSIGIASILLFRIGAAGMLLGFIAGNLTTAVAGMVYNRRRIFCAPALRKLTELLSVGLPLVLSGTSLWLIGYLNRPILVRRVSPDELGLYAIATGAVGMMALLIGAFRNAWHPFAFSIMNSEDARNIYGRALTLFTVAASTVAACGTLFAPEMLLVINAYTGKNWSGAAPCIGPLALGTLFSAMYFVVQTGVHIARRTGTVALTMGIGAALNLILNIVLIPRFGILGAALATALGHLTSLISLYGLAQRILFIPYQKGKLSAIVLLTVILIALAPLIDAGSLLKNLGLKAAILLLFGSALSATRAFAYDELKILFKSSPSQDLRSDSEELVN